MKTLGTPVSVPVCDDSAVRVECLTQERLGVNVTWKLRLEDVPPASLPDLRDVGMFPCLGGAMQSLRVSVSSSVKWSRWSCNPSLWVSGEDYQPCPREELSIKQCVKTNPFLINGLLAFNNLTWFCFCEHFLILHWTFWAERGAIGVKRVRRWNYKPLLVYSSPPVLSK